MANTLTVGMGGSADLSKPKPKPTPGITPTTPQQNAGLPMSGFSNPTTPAQQRIQVVGGHAAVVGPTNGQASANLAYMGTTQVNVGTAANPKMQTVARLMPVNSAMYTQYSLSGAGAKKLTQTMDRWYGKGVWDPSWVNKFWNRAVQVSANQYTYNDRQITPLDAYDQLVSQFASQGIGPDGASAGGGRGGGGGGGGGGGYSGPTTQTNVNTTVNLTDPDTARGLVDRALQSYLGRTATPKEQQAFMAALGAHEKASPQTNVSTTVSTPGAGGTSMTNETSQSVSGGSNSQQYAQEWAAAQQGAGEYVTATKYLDAFIGALKAQV